MEGAWRWTRRLWPFYERAEALGIVLDIHTGFSWVPPGKSKYAVPILLDDVARDFPQLNIVAFHMGYESGVWRRQPRCGDASSPIVGGGVRAGTALARDPEPIVGHGAVRVDDRVIALEQLGAGDVLAEADATERSESRDAARSSRTRA